MTSTTTTELVKPANINVEVDVELNQEAIAALIEELADTDGSLVTEALGRFITRATAVAEAAIAACAADELGVALDQLPGVTVDSNLTATGGHRATVTATPAE